MDHENGLLAAGYDGLKRELTATESDIEKLEVRAEKLRAALTALRDLIPARGQAPTNGAADTDVWLKHDPVV